MHDLPSEERPSVRSWVWPVVVFAVASALAGLAYARFLEAPQTLWWSGVHDRNAHYAFALNLGLDLRTGDFARFCHDLDQGSRVWTPLHGLLLGPILAVGGSHYWLGVLPSLTAWVGSAVLAFLVGRRAVPSGGDLAGLVAATFVLASPAHQAFATDIMLESLGGCLTLLALYFYLRVKQDSAPWVARALGLALTLQFFHKYNYWVLVVIGLTTAELAVQPREYWRILTAWWARLDLRQWTLRQLRHPLTYVIAAAAAASAAIVWSGAEAVEIAGQRIALRPTTNLPTLLYLLLVVRLAPWCWNTLRPWLRFTADARVRSLFLWHGLPVALWFLYPHRLGLFLAYVGPAHRIADPPPFLTSVQHYARWAAEDYHAGAWGLCLAFALALVGLVNLRRLRPGSLAIFTLLGFAALLTCNHPLTNSRFLHSWIAALWAAAGVGFVQLCDAVLLAKAGWAPTVRVRGWLTGAAAAVLIGLHGPAFLRAGHAPEGARTDFPTLLPMTSCYLDGLGAARRPIIASDCALRFLTTWTYLERYGPNRLFDTEIRGFGPGDDRHAFEQWANSTPCDALVFIHAPPGGGLVDANCTVPGYERLPGLLAEQSVFRQSACWEFPEVGCAVTLWTRSEATVAASGRR